MFFVAIIPGLAPFFFAFCSRDLSGPAAFDERPDVAFRDVAAAEDRFAAAADTAVAFGVFAAETLTAAAFDAVTAAPFRALAVTLDEAAAFEDCPPRTDFPRLLPAVEEALPF